MAATIIMKGILGSKESTTPERSLISSYSDCYCLGSNITRARNRSYILAWQRLWQACTGKNTIMSLEILLPNHYAYIFVCFFISHHEAYVLGNELSGENLNGAAKECAMWRIGRVIECNRSWCKALSLKRYVWFGSWNIDFLTDDSQLWIFMQIQNLGVGECQEETKILT